MTAQFISSRSNLLTRSGKVCVCVCVCVCSKRRRGGERSENVSACSSEGSGVMTGGKCFQRTERHCSVGVNSEELQ